MYSPVNLALAMEATRVDGTTWRPAPAPRGKRRDNSRGCTASAGHDGDDGLEAPPAPGNAAVACNSVYAPFMTMMGSPSVNPLSNGFPLMAPALATFLCAGTSCVPLMRQIPCGWIGWIAAHAHARAHLVLDVARRVSHRPIIDTRRNALCAFCTAVAHDVIARLHMCTRPLVGRANAGAPTPRPAGDPHDHGGGDAPRGHRRRHTAGRSSPHPRGHGPPLRHVQSGLRLQACAQE
jgi:hypothetical protein